MLGPRKTVEVGIAVSAALGTVNDIEVLKREIKLSGESLDFVLELAGFERGELIEERQDYDGVDSDHEGLDAENEEPQVVKEVNAGGLDDLEETSEDGGSESDDKSLGLDEISNELFLR